MKRLLAVLLVAVMFLSVPMFSQIHFNGNSIGITAQAATVKYKTTDALNMRKSASSSSKKLLTVPKGATVTSSGKTSGKYMYVTYKKSSKTYNGWVLKAYLKKISSSSTADKENKILYNYLKANYKPSNTSNFPLKAKKNTVFSAKVGDFDGDGHREMLAMILNNTNEYSFVIKYIRVVSGKAKLINTSNSIDMRSVGNWDSSVCMTVSGKNVYVYLYKNGYGGSLTINMFEKFTVSGGKLKHTKSFCHSIFYRYDDESMTESVSDKTYKTYSSFKKAVTEAGFDLKNHKPYKCKASSNVFSFYATNDTYMTSETFFKDNTSVKSKIK